VNGSIAKIGLNMHEEEWGIRKMKLGGDAEEFADEGSSGTHDVSNGKPLDSSARLNGWAISSLPFRRPPNSKTHLFNNIEGSFSKVVRPVPSCCR